MKLRIWLGALGSLGALALASTAAAQMLPRPDRGGVPDNDLYDYGMMGPAATPDIVADAVAAARVQQVAGPFRSDWQSIQADYRTPSWFADAKIGIFIHRGVEYRFDRPVTLSEVELKLVGWRSRSYSLKFTLDGRTVWEGITNRSLGYIGQASATSSNSAPRVRRATPR